MKNKKLLNLAYAALFAALTFVATAYLPRFYFAGGYVHIGDLLIYIAAVTISKKYAAPAAAVGGFLADLLTGYVAWAPFTLVIKALLVLPFTHRGKYICIKNIIALFAGVLITVGGYYIAEAILTVSLSIPLASLGYNVLQAIASGILYIILGFLLDRFNFKKIIKI